MQAVRREPVRGRSVPGSFADLERMCILRKPILMVLLLAFAFGFGLAATAPDIAEARYEAGDERHCEFYCIDNHIWICCYENGQLDNCWFFNQYCY